MGRLTQRIWGVEIQSPVFLASGTCGYGAEIAGLIPLDDIGGIVTKAVSLEPRPGNPPHRVAETPGGMINAIGLQNVGLDLFRREKLPWLKENLTRAHVFVNVVGRSVEDFAAVVAGLDDADGFLGYELNVSCPNSTVARSVPFAGNSRELGAEPDGGRREIESSSWCQGGDSVAKKGWRDGRHHLR